MRHDVNDATPRRRRREHPDPGRRTFSRSAIPVLAVVLVGSLVIAPTALANFIEPKSGGSPNANQIHSLYNVVLYVAAIVAVLVEGALVYSVWRFRAKRSPVAAQIHGNTRLEIGWTVAAALILVVLTVVTFIKLPSIVNPPNSSANGLVLSASVNAPTPPNGKKLTVCIQGRQFIWRYVYGNGCLENSFEPKLKAYSYTTMVVPEHTTVVLAIQSTDVIHSWWVPSLGGKVDAVPGYTTYTWFKALHTGTFRGQCAQLCGTNHAAMIAYVKVVTPDQYTAWVARQQQLIATQNAQVGTLRAVLTASNQLGN
ncbi:MAG TPA: cytochrome c oxidase subunit II [Solirubrobacteraceae bacterium]|nr:cytochrome c oxidase subunit II [Solirubrobacteraceae bacterium]